MKCISVRQPFASLIARDYKHVENRSWTTNHRGLIAIHAGVYRNQADELDVVREFRRAREPWDADLPRGGIIAIARLVGVVSSADEIENEYERGWYTGEYGWLLGSVQPVEFVPMRGRLGLFEIDDALIKPLGEPSVCGWRDEEAV